MAGRRSNNAAKRGVAVLAVWVVAFDLGDNKTANDAELMTLAVSAASTQPPEMPAFCQPGTP
jgi:hypothetical protein